MAGRALLDAHVDKFVAQELTDGFGCLLWSSDPFGGLPERHQQRLQVVCLPVVELMAIATIVEPRKCQMGPMVELSKQADI